METSVVLQKCHFPPFILLFVWADAHCTAVLSSCTICLSEIVSDSLQALTVFLLTDRKGLRKAFLPDSDLLTGFPTPAWPFAFLFGPRKSWRPNAGSVHHSRIFVLVLLISTKSFQHFFFGSKEEAVKMLIRLHSHFLFCHNPPPASGLKCNWSWQVSTERPEPCWHGANQDEERLQRSTPPS